MLDAAKSCAVPLPSFKHFLATLSSERHMNCYSFYKINVLLLLHFYYAPTYYGDVMVIISVRIDEEIKKKMDLYKDINWSEVARDAIKQV